MQKGDTHLKIFANKKYAKYSCFSGFVCYLSKFDAKQSDGDLKCEHSHRMNTSGASLKITQPFRIDTRLNHKGRFMLELKLGIKCISKYLHLKSSHAPLCWYMCFIAYGFMTMHFKYLTYSFIRGWIFKHQNYILHRALL